jgi:hypothetical protein
MGKLGAASGPLVMADISGYTGFLSQVTTAHADDAFADGNVPDAYALISSLLDTIVTAMTPPFTLAKIEGDAVFAYADSLDGFPHGADVLRCLGACYAGFRERLGSARDVWSCRCDACARVDTLDLKFVLHAGSFFIHPVAGGTELVGSEVVLVHRLVKNHARDLVGARPYAMFTSAAQQLLSIPLDGTLELVEEYEHLSPVRTHVLPLT